MTYAFESADADITAAIRRIATGELAAALAALAATDETAAPTHAVRKNIKMVRGLLRLVRPAFDGYRRENADLRNAGRALAPLRRAEVLPATAARLAHRADPALHAVLADPALWQDVAVPEPAGDQRRALIDEARAALAAVSARAGDWQVRGRGFAPLRDGLERTLAEVRRSGRKAHGSKDDAHLHEWRKVIKHHWYHARLLQPIWPAMMAPHIAAADDLAELLGDHQDLSDFRAFLPRAPLGAGMARDLDRLAEQRQRKLRSRAVTLADRLFAGPDAALVDRWQAWWKHWRRNG